jgi:O-antigen ligase
MNNENYINRILYLLYIIFFVSITCAFRAISSIDIALILVAGIVKNKIDHGAFFSPHIKSPFLITCCLFYFLQLPELLLSSDQHEALRLIKLKSGLIFVPLSICCGNYFNSHFRSKLMTAFVWILTGFMLICLSIACYKYIFLPPQPDLFFYHTLVKPFNQHAVQVSLLLFIGFVHLMETAKKENYLLNKAVHGLLVFFFSCCIVLLSSKLVIIFTAVCFCLYLYFFYKTTIKIRLVSILALFAGLLMIVFVLVTNNQVSKRFNEVIDSNMDLVSQEKFNPGIYFNGVQFRLLQVRFVTEILNEKNAWLTGVSANAQNLLIEKYRSTNMYMGDGKDDPGYSRYNTHNQFLESLLESGIPGLIAYSFIVMAMVWMTIRKKSRVLGFTIAILLAYSLNESVLERQYTLIIFTFFPMFFYFTERGKKYKNSVSGK